jgi:hypothetical protein
MEQTLFSPGVRESGRSLPLSHSRRLIGDLMHFARRVPSVPMQREMNVASLSEARARMAAPPSWVMIFTKAFGIMARRCRELRRAYLSFPYPHLYEHPLSIASVAILRRYQGEDAVFWRHMRCPESQPLDVLQTHLTQVRTEPVENFGTFRRAILMGRLPGFLRRLAWWIGLNSSGRKRAQRLGTFGISVYSGLGAESLHTLSPLTSTLNYGPIAADGKVNVRIIFDQRVLDGPTAARALAELEQVLNLDILAELHSTPARL